MDGVLVVDKPSGPTSHDVVQQARRLIGTRHVGHAGTLDPLASGVLLLLFGQATKLSAYLARDQKTYRAVVHFGRATTTLDAAGSTTHAVELESNWLSQSKLEAALNAERARTIQLPPAHSAIGVGGVRAHRLARQGQVVSLAARPVTVQRLDLEHSSPDSACIVLSVSKGYYVRSFARDLGERLGVPAHLGALARLASGSFTLTEAIPWPPRGAVLPLPTADAARRVLAAGVLSEVGAQRARLGQSVSRADFTDPPAPPGSLERPSAWFDAQGELVALGAWADPSFRVVRGFRGRADA